MNKSTGSKPNSPTLLSPSQLATISGSLPTGVTIIGGLTLSAEESACVASTFATEIDAGSPCGIVYYAANDHTIHRVEICQVKPDHYELGADTVVGTW